MNTSFSFNPALEIKTDYNKILPYIPLLNKENKNNFVPSQSFLLWKYKQKTLPSSSSDLLIIPLGLSQTSLQLLESSLSLLQALLGPEAKIKVNSSYSFSTSYQVIRGGKKNPHEYYAYYYIEEDKRKSSKMKKRRKVVIGQVCARIARSNKSIYQLRKSDIIDSFLELEKFKDNNKKIIILTEENLFEQDEDLFVTGLEERKEKEGSITIFSLFHFLHEINFNSEEEEEEYWYTYERKEKSSLCPLITKQISYIIGREFLFSLNIKPCQDYCCLLNSQEEKDLIPENPYLLLCPTDLEKVNYLFLPKNKTLKDYFISLLQTIQKEELEQEEKNILTSCISSL